MQQLCMADLAVAAESIGALVTAARRTTFESAWLALEMAAFIYSLPASERIHSSSRSKLPGSTTLAPEKGSLSVMTR